MEPSARASWPAPEQSRGVARTVANLAMGLAVAFVIVTVVGRTLRPEVEDLGRAFVDRFGYAGMGLATFAADAFTVPPPAWFYFVLSVASGASPLWSIAAVTAGSFAGACVAYATSARLSELWLFKSRVIRARERIGPLVARHGTWAMVLLGLLPLPFSILCYVLGSYRVGPRLFAIFLALRFPRLLLFYAIARLGW